MYNEHKSISYIEYLPAKAPTTKKSKQKIELLN